VKRAALVLVLALVAFLGTAIPAQAHADLLLSTPEDGAVLTAAPAEVVLTFSEELLPDTVVVSVADVIVTWPPGMTGSQYDVNYRVVSQDGHPIEGTVAFTVEAASPSASSPATAPPSASSPATASPSASSPAAAPSSASAVPVTTTETATESASGGSGLPAIAAISAGLAVGIAVGFLVWILRRRSGGAGDAT
jgi:methionine-rich copper-binding protein CopC